MIVTILNFFLSTYVYRSFVKRVSMRYALGFNILIFFFFGMKSNKIL